MFEAQLLIADSTIYSPWMPRAGDNLRATLDVVQVVSATIKVEVFTKNSDETGDGSNADTAGTPTTSISRNSAGRTTQEWDSQSADIGIKEMVRYKFTVTNSGGGDLAWVLFRMLDLVWWDSVDAS